MSKVSNKVSSYFKEVNTKHTKWQLRNGSQIDLTSEEVSEKDLRQLAVDNPKLFVSKSTKTSVPAAPDTKK